MTEWVVLIIVAWIACATLTSWLFWRYLGWLVDLKILERDLVRHSRVIHVYFAAIVWCAWPVFLFVCVGIWVQTREKQA